MTPKKILLIGTSFYPENSPRSFRTTQLAKEFARQGHQVTVLVPKNDDNHVSFEKEYGVNIKDLGSVKFKDINLTKGNKLVILFKRFLRRGLDIIFDFPSVQWLFVSRKALNREKNYDILISIAAPHAIHWGTAFSWKRNRSAKIWIADCGDPFMGTTTDTFKKPFYFKYFEKLWCELADYITVPFEGAKKAYYEEFHNKIKIIPQGFDFNEVNINTPLYVPNEIPTFAYAGELIPGVRDPKDLIEYILSLNIDFKFIFYTKSSNLIEHLAQSSRGKIEIRDYIPRKELLIELSKMDFLINFNNGVSTQLPSKLIDYYLTGRPVLSINSYDFDQEIIKNFLNKDYSESYNYENPNQYRIENVCKNFLSLANS